MPVATVATGSLQSRFQKRLEFLLLPSVQVLPKQNSFVYVWVILGCQ